MPLISIFSGKEHVHIDFTELFHYSRGDWIIQLSSVNLEKVYDGE